MIERLLDMANNLPFAKNTLSDKDKEYIERFYGYICAGADKSRALGYYAYRADNGDFVAHYIAGLCYYFALDFTSARKCFEVICAKSDSQSTFRHIDGSEFKIEAKDLQKIKGRCYGDIMGDMYYYGKGVEQNYNKAVELYQKGADLGDARAFCNLGVMYEFGKGVNQNYNKAVELYQKACDLGNANAFYNLGYMYCNGQGVSQNYNKAVELYQKACDLGDADAFCNLGYMYSNGRGVEQNYNKAVELYQKACDLGNAVAFCNLGYMYQYGQGVNQDKQKALQLYKKACDKGCEQGCKNYRILQNELNGGW